MNKKVEEKRKKVQFEVEEARKNIAKVNKNIIVEGQTIDLIKKKLEEYGVSTEVNGADVLMSIDKESLRSELRSYKPIFFGDKGNK